MQVQPFSVSAVVYRVLSATKPFVLHVLLATFSLAMTHHVF